MFIGVAAWLVGEGFGDEEVAERDYACTSLKLIW